MKYVLFKLILVINTTINLLQQTQNYINITFSYYRPEAMIVYHGMAYGYADESDYTYAYT